MNRLIGTLSLLALSACELPGASKADSAAEAAVSARSSDKAYCVDAKRWNLTCARVATDKDGRSTQYCASGVEDYAAETLLKDSIQAEIEGSGVYVSQGAFNAQVMGYEAGELEGFPTIGGGLLTNAGASNYTGFKITGFDGATLSAECQE